MYEHSARKRSARGGGTPLKRRRQVSTYVPRGRFMNYRTGGLQGVELKFYDLSAFTQVWGINDNYHVPILAGISTPAQGTGASERIGRRFTTKSVNVNFKFTIGSSTNNVAPIKTNIFKIFLVLDKQTNKAPWVPATPTTVFSGGQNTPPFINMENIDRYRILKSKTLVIEPNNTSPQVPDVTGLYTNWSGNAQRTCNLYWRGHINTLCEPGNVSAGNTSTMDNMIYIVVWTNSTTTAPANPNQPSFDMTTRTRFCC